MVRMVFLILPVCLAACVPTTRYTYVAMTPENAQLAKEGDAIPLVAESMAVCWPDGRTELVHWPLVIEDALCPEALYADDDYDMSQCIPLSDFAGVGIPYESRSMSAVPMASVDLGTCNPEDLR